jgi:hypothetical protein
VKKVFSNGTGQKKLYSEKYINVKKDLNSYWKKLIDFSGKKVMKGIERKKYKLKLKLKFRQNITQSIQIFDFSIFQ